MDGESVQTVLIGVLTALLLVNVYASLEDIHRHEYPPSNVHSHDGPGTATFTVPDGYEDDVIGTYAQDLPLSSYPSGSASGDGGGDSFGGGLADDGSGTAWPENPSSSLPRSGQDPANETGASDESSSDGWSLASLVFEFFLNFFEEILPGLFMVGALAIGAINNAIHRRN